MKNKHMPIATDTKEKVLHEDQKKRKKEKICVHLPTIQGRNGLKGWVVIRGVETRELDKSRLIVPKPNKVRRGGEAEASINSVNY